MYEQAFGQRRVGAAEAVEQKRFAAERAGSGKADTPGSSESINRRTASISRLGQTRRTFQNKGGPWMMPVRSVLYAVGWKNRPSGT